MKRILLFTFLILMVCYLLHLYINVDFNNYSKKWKNISYEDAEKEVKNINYFYKTVFNSHDFRYFIPPLNYAVKYNKDLRVIKLLIKNRGKMNGDYAFYLHETTNHKVKPLISAINNNRSDDIIKLFVEDDPVYSLYELILTPQYKKYIDKFYQTKNEINVLNHLNQNLLMYFLDNLQKNDYVRKNCHTIAKYILS